MPAPLLDQADILDRLAAAPDRLSAIAADVAPGRLQRAPRPDAWSANEILAHLRSCGDMWGAAIERMLAEDHPTIRAINPRTWIERTDYRELEFASNLVPFTVQRAALLASLRPLAPADWERAATITGAGPRLTLNVWRYADRMARHEGPHLRQIERASTGG